jgi:two-component system nitrate/nitrite response regulator NarL
MGTSMRGIIDTYIISSTDLIRGGIGMILQGTGFRVVRSGKTFCELKFPTRQVRKSLFIVSANGDLANIRNDIQKIRQAAHECYIVLLLSNGLLGDPMSLLQLGASACLTDTISADALLKSLDVVVADGVVLPPQFLRESSIPAKQVSSIEIEGDSAAEEVALKITPPAEVVPHAVAETPNLSDREALILRMLVKGESNKLIARGLNIAEATVKVHVKAILRKIRARNRTQAAIWAIRNGGQPLQPPPAKPAETHFASAGE